MKKEGGSGCIFVGADWKGCVCVFTAYDPSTREYFSMAWARPGFPASNVFVWQQKIDNAISNASLVALHQFTIPTSAPPVAMEVAKGKQYIIANDGTLILYNATTNSASKLVNILSGDAADSRQITTATAIDQDNEFFFAISVSPLGTKYLIHSVDLKTLNVTTSPLGTLPRGFYWSVLEVFEMVYVPTIKQCLVAISGNFDQLAYVDPRQPASELFYAASDLSQFGWQFVSLSSFSLSPLGL